MSRHLLLASGSVTCRHLPRPMGASVQSFLQPLRWDTKNAAYRPFDLSGRGWSDAKALLSSFSRQIHISSILSTNSMSFAVDEGI